MTTYFDTASLRVYRYELPDFPEDDGACESLTRALFVAFALDDSIVYYPPMPIVTATLFRRRDRDQWTVSWLETCELYRRQGFARETLLAIADHLGEPIDVSGGTPIGEVFCDAIRNAHVSLDVD